MNKYNIIKSGDIINKISTECINFVAYAITSWHLIGAKAVYNYLISQGIDINPLFIIDEHKDGGYFVMDDDEIILYHRKVDKGFSYFRFIIFLIKCLFHRNKKTNDIYIVNAWSPDFKRAFMTLPSLDMKFQFYLFEEGASQYRPEFNNLGYLWRHLSLAQFANKLVNIYLGMLFERRGLVHYFTPYKDNHGHIEINSWVLPYYKEVQHITPVDLNSKRVLIAMQSIQKEEVEAARNVAVALENVGYEVLIKEHPRYLMVGYGLDKYRIDARGKGLESLVPELAPKYILGFWSTTLLTMNCFYGIKPISLYFLLNMDTLDTEELKSCAWFHDTFKDVVCFPHSIGELKQILS